MAIKKILLCVFGLLVNILFVSATSTDVLLTIKGTYTGSISFDTTHLQFINGTYYTDRDDISFFVSATKSSEYTLLGDLSGFVGSGSGVYTNLYTLSTIGKEGTLSFRVLFSHSGEKLFSNTLTFIKIVDGDIRGSRFPILTSSNNGSYGRGILYKDYCPNGDNSGSYYDRICGFHGAAPDELVDDDTTEEHSFQFDFDVSCKNVLDKNSPGLNRELVFAYAYAIELGIINDLSFCDFLYEDLTRIRMAEIISLYAIKGLHKDSLNNYPGCAFFSDVGNLPKLQKNYATLSCRLGIMGLKGDQLSAKATFDPYDRVPRSEFGTVLSRTLFGFRYVPGPGQNWYENHLLGLQQNNILHNTNPHIQEKTSWVILMLWRNRNNLSSDRKDFIAVLSDIIRRDSREIAALSKTSRSKPHDDLSLENIKRFISTFFWIMS